MCDSNHILLYAHCISYNINLWSPGCGQVGAMDRGTQGHAPNPERRALQRDHRADRGHGSLHIHHEPADPAPKVLPVCRSHWHRQERLHHCKLTLVTLCSCSINVMKVLTFTVNHVLCRTHFNELCWRAKAGK